MAPRFFVWAALSQRPICWENLDRAKQPDEKRQLVY